MVRGKNERKARRAVYIQRAFISHKKSVAHWTGICVCVCVWKTVAVCVSILSPPSSYFINRGHALVSLLTLVFSKKNFLAIVWSISDEHIFDSNFPLLCLSLRFILLLLFCFCIYRSRCHYGLCSARPAADSRVVGIFAEEPMIYDLLRAQASVNHTINELDRRVVFFLYIFSWMVFYGL